MKLTTVLTMLAGAGIAVWALWQWVIKPMRRDHQREMGQLRAQCDQNMDAFRRELQGLSSEVMSLKA